MTKKDYADVLKFAIKSQIEYQKEEVQKPYADEQYHRGVIDGLWIAIDKINASMFLAEE
jgi:hypothetical protein